MLPMVTETEERREDWETSAREGWSPGAREGEGFMAIAVCGERAEQIKTPVNEFLAVSFS